MLDPHSHVPFQLDPSPDGGFAVRWQGLTLLTFQAQGTAAYVGTDIPDVVALKDILRWGAPFALARRGLFLLHAACIAQGDRAIAFLAPGGTGKSTLGLALADLGWHCVSDDALLCGPGGLVNTQAEIVLRNWCQEHALRAERAGAVDFGTLADALSGLAHALGSEARLGSIAFLELPRTRDGSFASEPLSAVAGFHRLVQHGIGAPPADVVWQDEARAYRVLANSVEMWRVHAPEGIAAMQDALPRWLATITSTSPQSPGRIAGAVEPASPVIGN